jgi:hypothetical protein
MEMERNSSVRTFLKPRVYDFLKFLAQILLPAFGSLYFGLSEIWGIPYGPEVVGSITVIDLFLGAVLGFSSAQYYKSGANFDGELKMVAGEDGRDKVIFDVESDPETVVKTFGKKSFEFRVNRKS